MPLENLDAQTHILDSIHRVDGRSVLDGAMMCGTIFMVFGSIYGFIWRWGPIIWGLLGLVGGVLLGVIIELAVSKLKKEKVKVFSSRKGEVIIQVTCNISLKNQLIKVLKSQRSNGFVIMPQRILSNT